MAKSERAKALAAKQKEERRARKLAKKHSKDPRDWGALRQLKEVYRVTKEQDPKLPGLLAVAFAVPFVVIMALTFWLSWGRWVSFTLWTLLAVMTGVMVMTWVLTRRAKRGTFKRYEGQAGSAEVALSMLPEKKWSFTPGITANRHMDVVHRALGPGGLILVGDGEPGRLKNMLASEKKKHDQILYGVQAQVIQMGNGTGQVPLDKLTDHIRKLPKQLTNQQIAETRARLRSLDAMRPRAPIPKGPINMKGARKAMRGR
ncbi:DUF4191 domain-containing protein [uncultured Tessaracoccus sp.]|uniref:DUF4191 domain-containing protein n=1 Tax=uncultured Tessaracoccus sp. TaxID=905023 RepID=UPI0025E511AB|nr:DUF4191 domain-containing protein [uncultured Tessaracoccus sp.]